MIPPKYEWLLYVALAGLAWGTYVPLIFYGGQELPTKPGGIGGRLMAILCVGIAYFLIAVVYPLVMFFSGQVEWPEMRVTGLSFSGLAGVAGAVGALCVVFASYSAVQAAKEAGLPREEWGTFRMYIAPLIFGLAPVINTLLSSFWHPDAERSEPFHFKMELPGWKLWVGILLVGLGAAMVLFAKEEAEQNKAKQKQHTQVQQNSAAPQPPAVEEKRTT